MVLKTSRSVRKHLTVKKQTVKDLEPVYVNTPIEVPSHAITHLNPPDRFILLRKALSSSAIGLVWEEFRPKSWDNPELFGVEFRVPLWKKDDKWYVQFPNSIWQFYMIDQVGRRLKLDWAWGPAIILMCIDKM